MRLSRRGKRHCAGSQCLDPYYDKMALPQHEGKPIQVQAIKGNNILVFLDCEIMWEWEWFSWFKMWNQMIVQVHTSFELRDVINIDDEKFTITFSKHFLFHLNHMKFIVVYRWRHILFWVFFLAVINIDDENTTMNFMYEDLTCLFRLSLFMQYFNFLGLYLYLLYPRYVFWSEVEGAPTEELWQHHDVKIKIIYIFFLCNLQ